MNGRCAATARRWLWRAVLAVTGGLTVTGALPRGGCVVVANHSSHADTAALLAALDARHAPRVAAAADYWFAAGWRSAACRTLAAAFPVRRTGGGSSDMAAAAALLRAGHAVVVFPEGTRGCGGPGRFHAGAFRLADEAGVPVVPVGIAGTGALLPKGGRLHRGPVAVRIGAAVSVGAADPVGVVVPARAAVPIGAGPGGVGRGGAGPVGAAVPSRAVVPGPARAAGAGPGGARPGGRGPGGAEPGGAEPGGAEPGGRGPGGRGPGGADAEAVRAEVTRLAAGPAPAAVSRWRDGMARLALSGRGIALVAAWAFAEAVVWPLVPELVLFALVVAAPRAGLRLVPTAVLASMAGGLVTLALGAAAPHAPLVTDRMRVQVQAEVAAEGPAAVRHQPLSGIPFKVYAAEAGRAHVEPLPFLEAALAHRGVRIALVGAGCALLGGALRRARHLYPAVLLGGTALFAAGFALVVAGWS